MANFNSDKFCERAKNLFGDAGQVELAQKIGVAQGVISSIKTGKAKSPSADTVYKIATYFGVSADWLLGIPGAFKTTDKATRELGKTFGFSESSTLYLQGNTPAALENLLFHIQYKLGDKDGSEAEIEGLKKNIWNRLSVEDPGKTKKTLERLITDHLKNEVNDRISLLETLTIFYERLDAPNKKTISVCDSLMPDTVSLKDGNGDIVRWHTSTDGESYSINLKEVLLSSSIQDVVKHLTVQKENSLKGSTDETNT